MPSAATSFASALLKPDWACHHHLKLALEDGSVDVLRETERRPRVIEEEDVDTAERVGCTRKKFVHARRHEHVGGDANRLRPVLLRDGPRRVLTARGV
jgi:hypothetical protein